MCKQPSFPELAEQNHDFIKVYQNNLLVCFKENFLIRCQLSVIHATQESYSPVWWRRYFSLNVFLVLRISLAMNTSVLIE